MQISISVRHGQVSAATQEKITQKVDKLQRYFDRVTAIDVTLDLEHRDSPSAELRVSAERTDNFVATDSASSVLAAVDGAIHKLEQQLRKHKDKRTDRRSTGHKHIEVPLEGDLAEGESDIE